MRLRQTKVQLCQTVVQLSSTRWRYQYQYSIRVSVSQYQYIGGTSLIMVDWWCMSGWRCLMISTQRCTSIFISYHCCIRRHHQPTQLRIVGTASKNKSYVVTAPDRPTPPRRHLWHDWNNVNINLECKFLMYHVMASITGCALRFRHRGSAPMYSSHKHMM